MARKALGFLGVSLLVAATLTAAPEVHAQTVTISNMPQTVQTVLNTFSSAMSQWTPALTNVAKRLFLLLAVIELIWVGAELLLKQADLSEIIARLITLIMFLGFFALFVNAGPTWIGYIYGYFSGAQAAVSNSTASPTNFITLGLAICYMAWDNFSLWPNQIGTSLAFLLTGVVSLICLVIIAAMLIEAIVESFFVQYAGTVFFGFGATRWTKDYSLKIITYAISVGAKIFCLNMIAILTYQIVNSIKLTSKSGIDVYLPIMCIDILMVYMAWKIPAYVQGMITGVSVAAGGTLLGTAKDIGLAAVGVAAAGAAATVAAGADTVSAVRDASSTSEKISQGVAGVMSMPARAAGELAQAAFKDLGGKLSGSYDSRFGTMGGRMAQTIVQGMGKKAPPESPGADAAAPAAKPANNTNKIVPGGE